jgi:hypothetical protein
MHRRFGKLSPSADRSTPNIAKSSGVIWPAWLNREPVLPRSQIEETENAC